MTTDLLPAILATAALGLFTALILSLQWGLREHWRRLESEQRREAAESTAAMLERVIRDRAEADEQVLRRMM